jgi:hypothetical protein
MTNIFVMSSCSLKKGSPSLVQIDVSFKQEAVAVLLVWEFTLKSVDEKSLLLTF